MKIDTDILKSVGITLTSCVAIVTALSFFLEPVFERKVKEQVEKYTHTTEFKQNQKQLFIEYVKTPAFEKELDVYLTRSNEESNNVSLRKLLSIRMGVAPEQVAEELSNMYMKDKKRLINLLKAVNEQHPEYRVWSID